METTKLRLHLAAPNLEKKTPDTQNLKEKNKKGNGKFHLRFNSMQMN